MRQTIIACIAAGVLVSGLTTRMAAAQACCRSADFRTRIVLQRAVEGAGRRLAQPSCQRVLGDFVDAAGRPLWAALEKSGMTPPEYLTRLMFVDDRAARPCDREMRMAFTAVGHSLIHICGQAFATATDHRLVEFIVIHELLHALGLGENPPSSLAITARVALRCGD